MMTKQHQTGGDESTNLQASTMIVNVGVDEKRAREIYQEMSLQLRREYSQEALKIANSRVEQFEDRLMPKMEEVNGALEAFADPGFQLLLVEAQKTAAATERPADYDLLSELLIHRFQKGENRVMRAGIGRAVEIVDEIADDALLGLTVAHAVSTFRPVSGNIIEGFNVLNELYGKIIYGKLPEGRDWLDHLDILDAARPISFGTLKKMQQYFPESLPGYVDAGIEKSSNTYEKVMDMLRGEGLPQNILVDHILNSSFVRIEVPKREAIKSLQLQLRTNQNGMVVVQSVPFSEKQFTCLDDIYGLYSQDSNVRNINIEAFIEEWDKRPNLKTVRNWWDSIPISFQITSVGKALAHSNAQRCDKSLPPLD